MLSEATNCVNSAPPLTKQPEMSAVMATDNLFPQSADLKRCSRCKAEKPLEFFNKSKTSRDGLQHKCKDCGRAECRSWYEKNKEKEQYKARKRGRINGPKQRERMKLWALANPERARYHSRKKLLGKKYNMTIEEHDALFASQGFVCGACGSPSPNSKKGWSTDHCHATGKVRGIVCHHCNIGIGHAKDNVQTMRKWVEYLERSQAV